MIDGISARLIDARTLALRAAMEMDEGEAKRRVEFALAALGDAIEQHSDDLAERDVQRLLEIVADSPDGFDVGEAA